MTSAFDTIDRAKLMECTKSIFGQDAWRMTLKLLTNTKLTVRIDNEQSKPFTTNIGSPQGDSLSPILFTVYLECAMRELRQRLQRPTIDVGLPPEICYADDHDFISRSKDFIAQAESEAVTSLAGWNLSVNRTKTEYTTLQRMSKKGEERWRTTKKLGTILGDDEELSRRRSLATIALKNATNLWSRRTYVSERRRLRIYNACVRPILTYNMGTWALTQNQTARLDAFHRKQLKRVLGIRYPDIISNEQLYKRTESRPLSGEMFKARWGLLGHILRMHNNIPATQAMLYYFQKHAEKGYKGKPRTTLATKIGHDLKKISEASSKKSTIASLPHTLITLADFA